MSNESKVRTIGDYLQLLRRRWVYPATIFPAAVLLSIFLAYTIEPRYRSTATIMLEASSIPEGLVQTTVTNYADQQFELVRRQVMSPQSLVALVGRNDPYPELDISAEEKAAYLADSTTVERVDPITLEPLQESTAFSLHYDNPDPARAAAIAQQLADMFLTYNRETRTAQAEQAYQFLRSKTDQMEESVKLLDRRIMSFKQRHASALPEDALRNEAGLERAQREYDDLLAQIRSNEQIEGQLAVQLEQLSPTLVGAVADPRNNLADLRAKLAEAEERYTADHPTVRQLQKSIATLVQRGNRELDQDTYNSPDNPEYLRVRNDLQATQRELSALRIQAGRMLGELRSYRSRLLQAPGVEPEYLQLQRERQVAQEQLEDARRKLRDAFFAQQFEAQQRGDRYSLIRAPIVAESPSSPNRLGFMLLGAVLGGTIAFGLAILIDVADPSVRGAEDVKQVTDMPILSQLPLIVSDEQRRRRRRVMVVTCAAFLIATIVVVWTAARQIGLETDVRHEAGSAAGA